MKITNLTRQFSSKFFLLLSFITSVTLLSMSEAEEADHAEAYGEHSDLHEHAHHEKEEDGEHDDHGEQDEHSEDDEPLTIAPEILEEFGIILKAVGPGTIEEEVILPGEIQFNREAVALITPRYDGTILQIKARLADQVEQGQTLAILENTVNLQPFELKAPFDGTIVNYNISLGQTVEARNPLFTIANLDNVWADLRIYQRDIAKIREGQSVEIKGRHDNAAYKGKIAYISPTVDEHTRTGLARVMVENNNRDWKPGQFIKGAISTGKYHAALLIPKTAILTHEGNSVVFLKTEEGFIAQPIKIGRSDSQFVEVTEGLHAGEVIVVENPISLKAEMGKASFGGHAGHVH